MNTPMYWLMYVQPLCSLGEETNCHPIPWVLLCFILHIRLANIDLNFQILQKMSSQLSYFACRAIEELRRIPHVKKIYDTISPWSSTSTPFKKYMDFWPPAQSASWHSNSSKQTISRHCPHRHHLWWYSGPRLHGTMDSWKIPNSKAHTSRHLPAMNKNKIRSQKLAICPKKIY